jgi:hypothetical protein
MTEETPQKPLDPAATSRLFRKYVQALSGAGFTPGTFRDAPPQKAAAAATALLSAAAMIVVSRRFDPASSDVGAAAEAVFDAGYKAMLGKAAELEALVAEGEDPPADAAEGGGS